MGSNQKAKWFVTAIIWLGAVAVSMTAIDSAQPGPFGDPSSNINATLLSAMAMMFAMLGTFFLWGLPEIARIIDGRRDATERTEFQSEKAKRTPGSSRAEQMALLMDLMDEDELADFKDQLKRRVLDGDDLGDMLDTLGDEFQSRRHGY